MTRHLTQLCMDHCVVRPDDGRPICGVGHGTVAFAGLLAADAILLGGIRGSDAGARDDQPAPDLFSAGQPCRDDAGKHACHVTDGDAFLAAYFEPGRRRGRCLGRHDDYRFPRFH